MIKSLAVFSLVVLTCACVNRDDNRKIIEAREIHVAMMQRYDSLQSALSKEEGKLKDLLNQESNADKRSVYESMSRSIDRSKDLLYTWEESVIGVPGLPPMDHKHHNHDGEHKHDHGQKDEVLKTLSDDEILSFQNAYATKLNELTEKVNELLTTMEMHEYYGK